MEIMIASGRQAVHTSLGQMVFPSSVPREIFPVTLPLQSMDLANVANLTLTTQNAILQD